MNLAAQTPPRRKGKLGGSCQGPSQECLLGPQEAPAHPHQTLAPSGGLWTSPALSWRDLGFPKAQSKQRIDAEFKISPFFHSSPYLRHVNTRNKQY